MALPRESAFLPTIKCSSCGRDVEISMMGDHLCGGPTAELSPPPEADEGFDSQFSQPTSGKYGWTPPPVDTEAANRAFMHRGQLTPVSQPSGSRSASPIIDSGLPATGRAGDLSSRSPGAIRRPGGYGGFGDHGKDEPDSALSSSFGRPAGPGFMQRMNTIAPGPFDTSRSPSTAAFPTRKDSLEKYDGPSLEELARPYDDRPSTSPSNTSGAGNLAAPPRAPRKNATKLRLHQPVRDISKTLAQPSVAGKNFFCTRNTARSPTAIERRRPPVEIIDEPGHIEEAAAPNQSAGEPPAQKLGIR
ncbi:hypothetical protein PLICBS_004787 [Purpureocillium lilacinum]|uniref:uncharacterized protein n=1 Tax=Purpureocillium lilacinum TaxID=33203 RepID=UPI0020821820|nr:hypothetical protein PLICBS_004787 [Purpureocillium lilacinum]